MPKIDTIRTKDEILALQSEANDSDSPESSIVAATLDWLFDKNASYPLDVADEVEEDEDSEFDDSEFEDDEEEEEEVSK